MLISEKRSFHFMLARTLVHVDIVFMTTQPSPPPACWRSDLEASRDLNQREKEQFAFLISWFESWRVARSLMPGREAATRFWREAVRAKERKNWQLNQWSEAVSW